MWIFLSNICKVLNDFNVQYLIIGGTCVAYHSEYRSTTLSDGKKTDKYDFDIWYRPTLDNYVNLMKSLKIFGFKDINDYYKFEYFRKSYDDYQLDFLPTINDIPINDSKKKFKEYYNNRDISTINNINLYFLSKKDLISIKSNSDRPKDIGDIKLLTKK